MAITYTGGARNGGNSNSPGTGTHGITINDGDFVFIAITFNSSTVGLTDSNSFTERLAEAVTSETCSQFIYSKTAGGSEPASYSFSADETSQWQCFIKVFSSDNSLDLSLSAATSREGSTSNDLICSAIDGRVIADDSLSLVMSGKDNRNTSEAYTVANQSHGDVVGNGSDQMGALCHRIYTTGETVSGNLTMETADGNDGITDNPFGAHITFVESSGGGGISIPVAVNHFRNQGIM